MEKSTNQELTKEDIKKSSSGVRFNNGKLRWSLVHFKSLEPMVRVLEFGAAKYDDHNWKKGLPSKEILESMQRHLAALIDGETHDKESGLSHIGHIQCNAMFYSFFTENKCCGNFDSEGKCKYQ
jgi:hypothetical protein